MRSLKRPLAALVLAPNLLTACATIASDVCPPVHDYSVALRTQAAAELSLLPPGAAIEQMMADYAVMRAQSRACRSLARTHLLGVP